MGGGSGRLHFDAQTLRRLGLHCSHTFPPHIFSPLNMPREQRAQAFDRQRSSQQSRSITCSLSASSVTAIVLCTLDDNTCSKLEQKSCDKLGPCARTSAAERCESDGGLGGGCRVKQEVIAEKRM